MRKWKEELLDQRRRMMEEKLLHAEFKREVQLQAIVKKAQEEEAKVGCLYGKTLLFIFVECAQHCTIVHGLYPEGYIDYLLQAIWIRHMITSQAHKVQSQNGESFP